jgi:hypothetical protein
MAGSPNSPKLADIYRKCRSSYGFSRPKPIQFEVLSPFSSTSRSPYQRSLKKHMKLAANVPETCCRFEFWSITESIDNNETKVRENGGTENKQTILSENICRSLSYHFTSVLKLLERNSSTEQPNESFMIVKLIKHRATIQL